MRGSGAAIGVVVGAAALAVGAYQSLWTVPGGRRGVVFNRVGGVSNFVYPEGTHLRLPWFQKPMLFEVWTRPKTSRSLTGTKDLQMVDITLTVLYRPLVDELPWIWSHLGEDYDERVLPSIVNETLKSVIAQFNASQLLTQRETVSKKIREFLVERALKFKIVVDDVSITHLTFGAEYTKAVEDKQVAQQEAQRAQYMVMKAQQDKKSTIIRAEAEARSAELIGEALRSNPAYIELRKLDAARQIAGTMAAAENKVYIPSDSLLLNLISRDPSATGASAAREAR